MARGFVPSSLWRDLHGVLRPHIAAQVAWTNIGEMVDRFYNRGIAGKTVLLF